MQNRESREAAHPALLAVGLMPGVMVWKQVVGTFRAYTDADRIVKVGTPGMSDSLMIVKVKITPDMVGKEVGIAVGPEFKTATGKQRENQINWQRSFERAGGQYSIVRTADDMLALVERVRRGEWR